MAPYHPIDCNQYDQLLAWATERKNIQLLYLNEAGKGIMHEGVIVDIYTKQGVEYLVLNSLAYPIRLDHILQVAGMTLKTCEVVDRSK